MEKIIEAAAAEGDGDVTAGNTFVLIKDLPINNSFLNYISMRLCGVQERVVFFSFFEIYVWNKCLLLLLMVPRVSRCGWWYSLCECPLVGCSSSTTKE